MLYILKKTGVFVFKANVIDTEYDYREGNMSIRGLGNSFISIWFPLDKSKARHTISPVEWNTFTYEYGDTLTSDPAIRDQRTLKPNICDRPH